MSYCLSCYVSLVPSKPAHQSDRTLHYARSLHSFVLWSYPVLSFMLPVGPTVTAEIQFASHVIIINFPAPPESLKCHFISPLELFTSAISRTHLPASTHNHLATKNNNHNNTAHLIGIHWSHGRGCGRIRGNWGPTTCIRWEVTGMDGGIRTLCICSCIFQGHCSPSSTNDDSRGKRCWEFNLIYL